MHRHLTSNRHMCWHMRWRWHRNAWCMNWRGHGGWHRGWHRPLAYGPHRSSKDRRVERGHVLEGHPLP